MAEAFPKLRFAPIDQLAAATTLLVSGKPNRRIVVDAYTFTLGAAGSAQFQSGSTPLTGAMEIDTLGGIVQPNTGHPQFETAVGEDLNIVSAGGRARGHLTYHYEGA